MPDTFDLDRFVKAQDAAGAYQSALAELRRGRKVTHWMWFVFPQIAGLGRSAMAERFAIRSLAEARAYLQHPVLGPRLVECARELTLLQATDALDIFGPVDAQKLRSCMTLFELAEPEQPLFGLVLDRYYAGVRDERTKDHL